MFFPQSSQHRKSQGQNKDEKGLGIWTIGIDFVNPFLVFSNFLACQRRLTVVLRQREFLQDINCRAANNCDTFVFDTVTNVSISV